MNSTHYIFMSTYFVPGNIQSVVGVHNTGGETSIQMQCTSDCNKCHQGQEKYRLVKDFWKVNHGSQGANWVKSFPEEWETVENHEQSCLAGEHAVCRVVMDKVRKPVQGLNMGDPERERGEKLFD